VKKWIRSLAILGALAVLGAWLFREPLLNECFDFLVVADKPAKADMAVVLGGGGDGFRILTAAQLVRDGYVPAALVSGPDGSYETPECDIAIPFAVRHGYPESYFRHIHGHYMTTSEEADDIIAYLRKENVKSILVVTSGYHTRRAGRYYRHIPGIEARMIAAPDRYAEHGTWWKNREGRKTMFFEWSKTVATLFGL
jgi:uncharacterized SAM-binding protein YcdF (DUF218 family)